MTKVYYDQSVEKDALQGKKLQLSVTVHKDTHAQNLKDNGYDVIVGIRPGHSFDKAKEDGFDVYPVAEVLNKQMSSWCYCQMKSKEMSIK